MLSNRPKVVYALTDPNTEQVRYVGITGNLASRVRLHVTHPQNDGMRVWVESLNGAPPKMFGLELLNSNDPAVLSAAERKWIQHYADQGADLLNVEEGGYNGFKLKPESRKKMAEAKFGTHQTAEHIEARIASCRGKPLSPEHRAKLSVARKGIVFSEETCRKMSETRKRKYALGELKRPVLTEKHLEKMRLGRRVSAKWREAVVRVNRARLKEAARDKRGRLTI